MSSNKVTKLIIMDKAALIITILITLSSGEFKMHSYEDVVTSLLYQQLFLEPNIIRDRRNVANIVVEGSDIIINEMFKTILSVIELWDTEKEMEYIFSLAEKIPFDRGKVINNYKKKLEPLLEEQLTDRSFKFLLCLSEILKEIQDKSTKKLVQAIHKKLVEKIPEQEINQRLDQLSQDSNVNFSLLINLGILNSYAKMVHLPPVRATYEEYFNKVVQNVLQE